MRLFLAILVPSLALAQTAPKPPKAPSKGGSKQPAPQAPDTSADPAEPTKQPAPSDPPKAPGAPAKDPKASSDAATASAAQATAVASAAPTPAPAASEASPRPFATVDAWKLDLGKSLVEVEGSDDSDYDDHAEVTGRIRMGITEHLELSVGQSVAVGKSTIFDTTPIAVRYALGTKLGDVLMNPVLEVAWLPREEATHRVQAKLLLSGEPVVGTRVAANLYASQNFERAFGADSTYGATFGASRSLTVRDHPVFLGAEGRLGLTQKRGYGTQIESAVGPSVQTKLGPVVTTGAVLADISAADVSFHPQLSLAYVF
jgi:hypothetical protein